MYTRHVAYLIEADQEILAEHPEWTVDFLDWCGPGIKPRSVKYLSGIKRRLADLLLRRRWYSKSLLPVLFNRFYFWQLKKAVAARADLYIAHYPESIAVAARAARINHAFFAYDAEDFHRGEDLPRHKLASIATAEDKFLPDASYITAASPLIASAYRELFPLVAVNAVENMFSLKRQPPLAEPDDRRYSFFWFSQTIGPKRGIEEFIRILARMREHSIRLTLLGNINPKYKTILTALWKNEGLNFSDLTFLETVKENEIFKLAAAHHFGLCLERPLVLNKEFCLSNKLYTYLLSGNFLILSRTAAQQKFSADFPDTGILIDLENVDSSAKQINLLLSRPDFIKRTRKQNYELGRTTLNFDREKDKLLSQAAGVWK